MNIELLSQELERDEDYRRFPYRDAYGNVTIGVGRNLTAKGVSHNEALLLLKNDIIDTLNELDRFIPWWRQLDEVRQRVLANMCFNLGIERLLTFKRMIAALKSFDYETAAEEMADSGWDKEVGQRAVRLVAMMRAGQAEAKQ